MIKYRKPLQVDGLADHAGIVSAFADFFTKHFSNNNCNLSSELIREYFGWKFSDNLYVM